MADNRTEMIQFSVPKGTGYLVGNTLRQFAMRGSCTWQPAAYRLVNRDGTFGLKGDYNFSCLTFLKGVIEAPDGTPKVNEQLCKFVKNGDIYICGDMVLKNLGNISAPSLDVCCVYASGSRTEEENYEVVKSLCAGDVDNFITVPSKHTRTIKFKFDVTPVDQYNETLSIEATAGSIANAKESAIKSLVALSI